MTDRFNAFGEYRADGFRLGGGVTHSLQGAKPLPPAQSSALDTQVGGAHYKDMKIQPVQFIHANNIPFLEACIIKRVCRWRDKGGIQDLEKIKHEVDLLIELERRHAALTDVSK